MSELQENTIQDKSTSKPVDPLKTDLKYELSRLLNLGWFGLFHCIRYRGVQTLPETGPIIFTPNHVTYYDPPVIAAGIPHRIRFMAWDALFKVPVLRGIMLSFGAYPVKLKTADKGAVVQTLKLLRNGEAVMIFPEGNRSPDGMLMPFEQGPARLAIQTNAALVPVTIAGAHEAWPSSRMLPRLFKPINIKYHQPIYPANLPSDLNPKQKADEINRRITSAIDRRLRAWNKLRGK